MQNACYHRSVLVRTRLAPDPDSPNDPNSPSTPDSLRTPASIALRVVLICNSVANRLSFRVGVPRWAGWEFHGSSEACRRAGWRAGLRLRLTTNAVLESERLLLAAGPPGWILARCVGRLGLAALRAVATRSWTPPLASIPAFTSRVPTRARAGRRVAEHRRRLTGR